MGFVSGPGGRGASWAEGGRVADLVWRVKLVTGLRPGRRRRLRSGTAVERAEQASSAPTSGFVLAEGAVRLASSLDQGGNRPGAGDDDQVSNGVSGAAACGQVVLASKRSIQRDLPIAVQRCARPGSAPAHLWHRQGADDAKSAAASPTLKPGQWRCRTSQPT